MNEDETIMHLVVQVLGADGITVTMELGQLIGLQRLLQTEREQVTGRHGFILHAEVGDDGSNRAVGWRWAGEEETMEWRVLPFATLPEPEGHKDERTSFIAPRRQVCAHTAGVSGSLSAFRPLVALTAAWRLLTRATVA